MVQECQTSLVPDVVLVLPKTTILELFFLLYFSSVDIEWDIKIAFFSVLFECEGNASRSPRLMAPRSFSGSPASLAPIFLLFSICPFSKGDLLFYCVFFPVIFPNQNSFPDTFFRPNRPPQKDRRTRKGGSTIFGMEGVGVRASINSRLTNQHQKLV